MAHRYRVGQILELQAAPSTSNRQSGPYQVVFCLPKESGPYRYRIRSLQGGAERVVDEIDLSPSSAEAPTVAKSVAITGIAVRPR